MDYDNFVTRYVAVWNEPDPAARRAMIRELWAGDCVQYTESAEYHGLEEMEERVTSAHDRLVRDGGHVFVSAGDATGHHDALRFTCHMLPAGGGDIAWRGAIFLTLGADGLIMTDHQFGDPPPPAAKAAVEAFQGGGEGAGPRQAGAR
ncbi:nuclear transport factor 2 family protein [Actinomadura sp. NEAU-AAG7]|uniref:nuclear transport factor 2 family protein n=1 Tax=Actinomadura sp. NEAU-AAG7 TaxID=2839640 RepID=UPI001BE4BDDA|nr:nuclear transport factor 2 family protein [Actinomadura sp. NEAU-AAG7]MBT2211588.1 nuclear transport factor 2 family protein [Actinomadura sp. NEAU-AAG7]